MRRGTVSRGLLLYSIVYMDRGCAISSIMEETCKFRVLRTDSVHVEAPHMIIALYAPEAIISTHTPVELVYSRTYEIVKLKGMNTRMSSFLYRA
jgi:hypothetical protein